MITDPVILNIKNIMKNIEIKTINLHKKISYILLVLDHINQIDQNKKWIVLQDKNVVNVISNLTNKQTNINGNFNFIIMDIIMDNINMVNNVYQNIYVLNAIWNGE